MTIFIEYKSSFLNRLHIKEDIIVENNCFEINDN